VTNLLVPLLAAATLAAQPEVSLKRLEGGGLEGRLQGLTTTSVELATTAGTKTVPAAEILWLDFGRSSVGKPAVWIELVDGSRLHAMAYTSGEGTARITLATGGLIELPARAVHSVRFHQQAPELALQWREIASSMATGDILVIRKVSTRTIEQGENEPRTVTEHALDQVEGTVQEVTPDTVRFELDGEAVNVRREKLEGIIYYQRGRRELPAAAKCRLIDTAGSQWLLSDIALMADRLAVTTLGGHKLDLRLADTAKIDFSVGNVAYLSDLESDSPGEPAISLQPSNMTYKFSRIFALRAGPPLGTNTFRMGGERYDNGLSLHSPTKLDYRVPPGFKKFHAVAGIDDSILSPGRFTLTILADNKEVARHEFSDEQRKPVPLTLDVSQARRLSIVLEAGDGQDIGDQLNLCEARFTK
jgi:hypothetical protein